MIFYYDLDFDIRKFGDFTNEMQKEPILLIYLDTVVIKVSDFIHMDIVQSLKNLGSTKLLLKVSHWI